MICYMPFSYLSEERLCRVTRFFGKVTIYQPGDFLLTDDMRRHLDNNALEARIPADVDQGRLRNVLRDFKSWAARTQSRAGDLAGFFRSMEGRLPMMDESNPSQIGTQIRRFGRQTGVPEPDPLFQAVLFMAVAHEYDTQQESLSRELGSIQALEQRMFDRLAGRPEVERTPRVEPGPGSGPEEAGLYMTEQRIQAWATVAAADPLPPWAYLTHSRAVWESVLEKLPEMMWVGRWAMQPTQAGPQADWLEAIEALAFGREPSKAPTGEAGPAPHLSLYVLAGCDPCRFRALLSNGKVSQATDPRVEVTANTVLGLLEENA